VFVLPGAGGGRRMRPGPALRAAGDAGGGRDVLHRGGVGLPSGRLQGGREPHVLGRVSSGAALTSRAMRRGATEPGSMERVRALCLALPEAFELETWDHPTFRVGGGRGKIFCTSAA